MIKKVVSIFLFLLFLSVGGASAADAVLMTVAGKKVTQSEFEYFWKKNNTNDASDAKSLKEYVDLFVNFKLKVAEAEAQGIDTTLSFKSELQGYRSQLTAPYLTDKDAEEAMIRESYDRLRQYAEISVIFVNCPVTATPSDTLRAYQKIASLYDRIGKGEDFAKLAKLYSDDYDAKNGGYKGFATGLRSAYFLENAAYQTPIGGVSSPVRTSTGYYLVKVHSRQAAGGRYRAGHIMKALPAVPTPKDQAAIKDSIFKIYEALKKGGDFKTFATKFSDDQSASRNGGAYDLMFCGSLPYEFEQNLYKLKIGAYSAPFQSQYGWHIVQALEFKPYPSLDEMREEITGFVNNDPDRSLCMKSKLVDRLKMEHRYSFSSESFKQFVAAYNLLADKGDSTLVRRLAASSVPLFFFGTEPVPQRDFYIYLSEHPGSENDLWVAMNRLVGVKVLEVEDRNLEKKYVDFGHLMEEYRDGILLFEVSSREVWDKASKDIKGLETYFAQNKNKYRWDKPRYKGAIVSCTTPEVAKKVKKLLSKLPSDSISVVLKRTFNSDTLTRVHIERGLFAEGENAQVDFLAFKKQKVDPDKKFPVTFLQGKVLKKGPEAYSDVRGQVIADYQTYLEARWIASLRAKYKVEINQAVLNTVNYH
jgi:peptidyl-prolyl cis-trans isomerase SurA